MKKNDLLRIAAMDAGSPSAAPERLDQTLDSILNRLRRGRPVRLPGLGQFVPGATPKFEFNQDSRGVKGGRRGHR